MELSLSDTERYIFNKQKEFFLMYNKEIAEHDYICSCTDLLNCKGIRKGHNNRCLCNGNWDKCYENIENEEHENKNEIKDITDAECPS